MNSSQSKDKIKSQKNSAVSGRGCFLVFPGITLSYEPASCAEDNQITIKSNGKMLEIRHCRSGRAEFNTADGLKYLSAGDMYVGLPLPETESFFSADYSGIVIRADVEDAPECLSCILDDITVRPQNLLNKFSSGFFSRSDRAVSHIFSELYSVPERIRNGYFKVKVLELFLFLSETDEERNESEKHTVTPRQIKLTCDITAYINANSDNEITLDNLAYEFGVSPTSIKNALKAVFSASFSSYLRSVRMKKAAELIRKTDMSILDIAQSVGYSNPSKFAKAFRDERGTTPVRYRKM